MDPTFLIEAWKIGGLVGLLVAYLLVRDYLRDRDTIQQRAQREKIDNEREAALVKRIEEIDEYQREELYTLATEANRAVLEAAKAQLATAQMTAEIITVLKTKPCIAEDMHVIDERRKAIEESNAKQ